MKLGHRKVSFATISALVATALLIALVAACGMVPPPEYHIVAETPELDVGITGDKSPADGGLSEESDASVRPEIATIDLGVGLATIPALALSDLLGKTRESIEIILPPVEGETREERKALKAEAELGWTYYTDHMKIMYSEDEFAVKMIQDVPEDINCPQAAIWMGFRGSETPEEKDGLCVWSKGGLGEGFSGQLDTETREFTAVLEDVPMHEDDEEKPLPTAD